MARAIDLMSDGHKIRPSSEGRPLTGGKSKATAIYCSTGRWNPSVIQIATEPSTRHALQNACSSG